MKNLIKKTILGVLTLGVLASCQKSKDELNHQLKGEEGFARTGESTEVTNEWKESLTDESLPDFTMHYSADLSEAEAMERWNKDLKAFKKRQAEKEEGKARSCSNFKYTVRTYTGSGTYDDTNGKIMAHHHFEVNGNFQNHTVTLNNSGNWINTGWDFFHFTKSSSSTWSVKLTRMQIALQGTEGWGLKHWHTIIDGDDQNCSAFGESNKYNIDYNGFLDSNSSSEWDLRTIWVNDSETVHFF